jgi:archaemetzincin
VNALYVVAIGTVSETALQWAEEAASEWIPLPLKRLPPLPMPEAAFDAKRKQYQSVEVMKMLSQFTPHDAVRLLGVTDADLAVPVLTFLFGQAQLNGPLALVSLCRLHQEFYGLPADPDLLRERTVKEVLHELGHTFGLTHCSERKCAMSLATHIGGVDAKSERYCDHCGLQLVEKFASLEEKL